jgi:hypothetical protein
MSADPTIQTALRHIYDRLGGIDAKLESGSKRHEEMSRGIADIDGKFDVLSDRIGKVETIAARIPVIEPAVWELEGKRLERQGAKKFVSGVFKSGHAISGAIGAALTWLGAQAMIWPWPKP